MRKGKHLRGHMVTRNLVHVPDTCARSCCMHARACSASVVDRLSSAFHFRHSSSCQSGLLMNAVAMSSKQWTSFQPGMFLFWQNSSLAALHRRERLKKGPFKERGSPSTGFRGAKSPHAIRRQSNLPSDISTESIAFLSVKINGPDKENNEELEQRGNLTVLCIR